MIGGSYTAGRADVTLPDTPTRSFIVRIWLEQPATGSTACIWRGAVTDVLDQDKAHFSDLDQLAEYIRSHLRLAGIECKPQPEERV